MAEPTWKVEHCSSCYRRTSHFATCPDAKKWRSKGRARRTAA